MFGFCVFKGKFAYGIQVACGDGGVIELLRLRREDGRKLWFAEAPEFTGIL